MTREEAITKLKSFCHNCEKFPTCVNTDKECFKALETAIEVLEQEPCDCITLRLKKGALKYSDKDYVVYKKEWLKKWWQPELELLGIQPKPKTGHWIIIDDCEHFIAKCSQCGRIEDSRMINKYPYCHCGAKMEEKEENNG